MPLQICVELCSSRYDSMRDPDRWKKLDLARVIREKKLGLLASSLILSAFQKRIGETTGARPGEEMMEAAMLAEKTKARLVLADREVRITLTRAWSQVGLWTKMWLGSNLFASLLVREEIPAEEIERLKREDVLLELFTDLPPKYQGVRNAIIDERDQYLAANIRRAAEEQGKGTVLAVVGAGHLAGIERILSAGEHHDIAALDHVPKKSRFKAIAGGIVFSALFLGLSAYLSRSPQDFGGALIAWVVCRSGGALLGGILSLAHPLTTLVVTLLAPVSIFISLFTGTRLWMFGALTELKFRHPRVEDFENIASETETLRGFLRSLYQNRVMHLLFVTTMISTGFSIGLVVFGFLVGSKMPSVVP
ncbi:MAG: TraB family protein [Spirochaetia bacterium]|nr:TraB family protein [Spirochaetia bacterium]